MNGTGYELRKVTTAEEWQHLHRIRRDVLFVDSRSNIIYDENHPDDRISENRPYLLWFDEQAIGTTRLDQRSDIGIVRLVATVANLQRMGHGTKLQQLIEEEARRSGMTTLRVNAAPGAVGFYRKTGWEEYAWDPSELTGLAADAVQMQKSLQSV